MRVLALAVTALLAACSGDGGGGSTKATRPDDPAANKTRAAGLTFQASDFPSGWAQVPSEAPEAAQSQDKAFRTCLGLGADEPEASSTFGKDDALASSEINVAASAEAAAGELATFAGPKGPDCVEQALKEAFEKVAPPEIIRISVGRLKLPAYAQSSVAYRAVVRVGTEDAVVIYADVMAIRQGSVEASVSFSNVGKAVPESLEKSLLEKLADRMAG
jgi:hypothetical protein